MTTAVIVTVGAFFAGMGCIALAIPGIVPKQFGMTMSGSDDAGRAEVRAIYGGFGLAMAAMLALALIDDTIRTGVLVTIGAALAGMSGGRVISAILGDRTSFYPNWFYCAVEVLAAAALFAIIW